MKYLLDTDICIHVIRRRSSRVIERLKSVAVGDVAISSITVAELWFGVQKSSQPERNREALEHFLSPLSIADFDCRAAALYGSVRADLERSGKPIGRLDTLIAAHALSLNLTLVTANCVEFSRVAGLAVEDWVS